MRAVCLLMVLLPFSSVMADELSTPESAIASLEAAYREKNIEKAVKAKDFQIEAKLMLEEMNKKTGKKFYVDKDIVNQTAEVLELSFRKEIKEKGFPDFTNISCNTPKKELYRPGIYKVLEICQFSDGGTSQQWLLVGKASAGWRVLNPID